MNKMIVFPVVSSYIPDPDEQIWEILISPATLSRKQEYTTDDMERMIENGED